MTAPRLTPAMVAALRLASKGAIRYYRGGFYTSGSEGGLDQTARLSADTPTTTPATLRALASRGLLGESHDEVSTLSPIVYGFRWTITPAGRDALAAIDADAREDASK